MIFGNIENTNGLMEILPDAIQKALKFLKENDISSKEVGEYEIQGRDIYVQIIDTVTKDPKDAKPEVHRKYIDIQFLSKGSEKIKFTIDNGKNKVYQDILEERDLLFYESVENESELVMKPGNFAIFYPQDVHTPALINEKPESIRKVVVKVKVDLV